MTDLVCGDTECPFRIFDSLLRMGSWRALAGWQLSGDYLLFYMYKVKCGPSGPPFIFVLLICGRKRAPAFMVMV